MAETNIDPQVQNFLGELRNTLNTGNGLTDQMINKLNDIFNATSSSDRIPTNITGTVDCDNIKIHLDKNAISSQNSQLHKIGYAINTLVNETDLNNSVPWTTTTSSNDVTLTIPRETIEHLQQQGFIDTVPQNIADCKLAQHGITGSNEEDIALASVPNETDQALGRA